MKCKGDKKMPKFKYIKTDITRFANFYMFPKELLEEPEFENLSSDAKILYTVMLNRTSLSIDNNWVDDNDNVYIIMMVEEVERVLHCQSQKALTVLKELDAFGLIERTRVGVSPIKITYVKSFIMDENCEESLVTLNKKKEKKLPNSKKKTVS